MTLLHGLVSIPSSFEALREAIGEDRIPHVLLETPDDLLAIKRAAAEVSASGQGKLLFIRGQPGQGKTSLIESSRVFLSDVIGHVVTAPPEYALGTEGLSTWLYTESENFRRHAGRRLVVVNLDGRETPSRAVDETTAYNLNRLLRTTPGLLLLWPVNSEAFATNTIAVLQRAGGQTALASDPVHVMSGLSHELYFDALTLVLNALGLSLGDAAISDDEARSVVRNGDLIGDYLRLIQNMVLDRYSLIGIGVSLPRLTVVVSSNTDTYDAVRHLTRGERYLIDPDRILRMSRANVADDWRVRAERNPRHSLAFVASLFEARFVNVTSSGVVNACAFSGDTVLEQAVRAHYPSPVRRNAANALRNSALARHLRGETDSGVGTSAPGPAVQAAYAAIQRLSATNHGAINKAIVNVMSNDLEIPLGQVSFEHRPFSDGRDLRIDVWFKRGERPETLEFTHRDEQHASPSTMASYILQKLEDYARDYQLI